MPRLSRTLALLGALTLLTIFFVDVALPRLYRADYKADAEVHDNADLEPLPVIAHIDTPESVKAFYMTACVAATPTWRYELKALIESTELNSVVIDIKDYTGTLSYSNDLQKDVRRGCVVGDLREFIAELHQSGIYAIGRISVFQDLYYTALHPELAVKSKSGGIWRDYKGISFIDVGAKPYWDYIVDISNAAYSLGFDELNFDYVRYPSDGNMEDADYTWKNASSTRAEMLEGFFSYLHDSLAGTGVKTSVDLFGMTTTVQHDMGIGQVLERALPYFDYVDPMVYPSHYPATWSGFANPAEHPYEVIAIAMARGMEREQAWLLSSGLATSTPSKLRPWLQDFNLGATYGQKEVRDQIQATYDTGLTSWLVWSAANRYTASVLEPDAAPLRAGQ